jgi:succinate dehydrogenase hydrophobic anchor subunit
MVSTHLSICSLVVMVSAIILVVFAFLHIFAKAQENENDLNVIQRQLRGFAVLIIANLVMIVGGIMCSSLLKETIA